MTDVLTEFETKPSQPHWCFDGSMFWVTDAKGNWVNLDKSSFSDYLICNPFQQFAGFKEEGQSISPADKEKLRTMVDGRVAYAGPLAGWNKGFQRFEDTDALITKSPTLMKPEAGTWQIFYDFLAGLMGHDKKQMESFLFWCKHTLEALYEGRPRLGLALVLAGEAGCGKTLLKEFVREMFGGREVYPYAYMMGKDNFNRELTESPLWVIDDEAAETSLQGRIKFGAEVKKVVANSAMRCRGMHQNGITLSPLRRLCICVNVEPDRLLVLPPIDDDIADKMLICKCDHPEKWPMPMGTHDQKTRFFQAVKKELPAFIHQMLEADIPDEYRGRFGVRHYHHPDVVESLMSISPEYQMAEQIDRALFGSLLTDKWEGSTHTLYQDVLKSNQLTSREMDKFPQAAWIGRRLSKLADRFPALYQCTHTKNGNVWTIHKKGGSES